MLSGELLRDLTLRVSFALLCSGSIFRSRAAFTRFLHKEEMRNVLAGFEHECLSFEKDLHAAWLFPVTVILIISAHADPTKIIPELKQPALLYVPLSPPNANAGVSAAIAENGEDPDIKCLAEQLRSLTASLLTPPAGFSGTEGAEHNDCGYCLVHL